MAPKLGLRDGFGNPPKARTLRETFDKVEVRKRREAELAAKQAAARKPVAKPGPPPVAHAPHADSWRPPRQTVHANPSAPGAGDEHPLIKQFRERSGG